MTEDRITIGFIGQGFVGKHLADDYERRGFATVRYSLDEEHRSNGNKIADCDIVFIAVPTPTTPKGFDASRIREVLPLVRDGAVAVIKSTILPGTTEELQRVFPKKTILFSPEFLSESTAAYDAAHPFAVLIGYVRDEDRDAALQVLAIHQDAPHKEVCRAVEAELFKYFHNMHGYMEVVFANVFYDLAQKIGASWDTIREAATADPMIPNRYLNPVHQSGRGAGGNCFIKDFAAFKSFMATVLGDKKVDAVFEALEKKNNELLKESGKSLDLLKGVYGDEVPN